MTSLACSKSKPVGGASGGSLLNRIVLFSPRAAGEAATRSSVDPTLTVVNRKTEGSRRRRELSAERVGGLQSNRSVK